MSEIIKPGKEMPSQGSFVSGGNNNEQAIEAPALALLEQIEWMGLLPLKLVA